MACKVDFLHLQQLVIDRCASSRLIVKLLIIGAIEE